MKQIKVPLFYIIIPILVCAIFFIHKSFPSTFLTILLSVGLIATVMAAVHFAELIAHRVGEPFGTIILAIAVTVIEAGLIIMLMSNGGEAAKIVARDSIFAAVMIVTTGVLGLSLLLGAIKYGEQHYSLKGVRAGLTTLLTIVVLVFILPNFTVSEFGPNLNSFQLTFIGISTSILYFTFIFIQTVRHRNYFLPAINPEDKTIHLEPPNKATTITSLVFLLICLAIVVFSAKSLAPYMETIILDWGLPKSLLGIVVATIVLLPESIAAIRAALNNRIQTSLNLSIGSALACIGLSIPVLVIASKIMGIPMTLGVDSKSMILVFVSILTLISALGAGKTNILQGVIHIILFFAWLFFVIVP